MRYRIADIEGIGPSYAENLAKAGIDTTDKLIVMCGNSQGRKLVSEKAKIGEKHLLKWVNLADLMRIDGIGPQFSELLEAAGVDTIKELRTRNAENLTTKMEEVNTSKKLTRTNPSLRSVKEWIRQAEKLPPKISH